MSCKISLEQQIINALIRRKSAYISEAMNSPEYRKSANNAKAETSSYAMLAKNPEVTEAAKELCEIINDALNDPLNREEFSAAFAYNSYNNTHEIARKTRDLETYAVVFENPLKKSVIQKTATWARLMERQYGLILNIMENAMQFGAENALTKEAIDDAMKTKYHSAKEYLEFEAELQDSVEAFSRLNAELAMHRQMEVDKEMAELYNDIMVAPDSKFYLALVAEKAVSLAKVLALKAAELEAKEVFSGQDL